MNVSKNIVEIVVAVQGARGPPDLPRAKAALFNWAHRAQLQITSKIQEELLIIGPPRRWQALLRRI